ncbi:MAG: Thiamine-phosphate pyrophosphorylase [Anaerosporomusa subterranea]|nr:Thiamine-phosphate pyrophosphorylase [Anaerosporomusa subterranea]
MKRNEKIDYSLYLVTDRQLLAGKDLAATVEQAIQGGASVVQLREKDASTRDFYRQAVLIKEITGKYHVPFIINDRADIALAVDADGLHIGQEDLPLHIARQIVGPEKLIGVSTTTLEQALAAEAAGADYLGIGAVAIGGINETNINSVMAVGVDGAAVVSAIIARPDPLQAAAYLRQLIALSY